MRGMKLRTEIRKIQPDEGDLFSYTEVSPENALLGHMDKSLVNLQYKETLRWQGGRAFGQMTLQFSFLSLTEVRTEHTVQQLCIKGTTGRAKRSVD